jgi:hypothetical protein
LAQLRMPERQLALLPLAPLSRLFPHFSPTLNGIELQHLTEYDAICESRKAFQ